MSKEQNSVLAYKVKLIIDSSASELSLSELLDPLKKSDLLILEFVKKGYLNIQECHSIIKNIHPL